MLIIDNYTKTVTTYPGNQLFVYGQEVDRQLQDTKTQLASVLARLDALESA
jgi:hypothetical protein